MMLARNRKDARNGYSLFAALGPQMRRTNKYFKTIRHMIQHIALKVVSSVYRSISEYPCTDQVTCNVFLYHSHLYTNSRPHPSTLNPCKVCHAAACGRHSHTGVLADADSIPARTSSPTRLSFRIRHFVFVSGATIACPFHLRSTSLHIRLADITRSITIVTLAPYCLPTPPFQVSFATIQRSPRPDAPPQNPSCSLPT